jgi:hypothetical protein
MRAYRTQDEALAAVERIKSAYGAWPGVAGPISEGPHAGEYRLTYEPDTATGR